MLAGLTSWLYPPRETEFQEINGDLPEAGLMAPVYFRLARHPTGTDMILYTLTDQPGRIDGKAKIARLQE